MTEHDDNTAENAGEIEELDGLFIDEDEDDDEAPEDVAADDGVVSVEDELRATIEALEGEKVMLHERLLRTAAELENSRRRHQKERDELRKFGGESVLKNVVVIADDLERALEHVRAQAGGEAGADAAAGSILEGIDMVYRKFLQTLERMGVTPVDARGKAFDPHLHEAIQQVSDPSVPNNTVAQVFQKGYMLHDRLLRPALVVVAHGGPPAESEGESLESDAVTGDNGED